MQVTIDYTFDLYNDYTYDHDIEVPTSITFDVVESFEPYLGGNCFEINGIDDIYFYSSEDEDKYLHVVEQLADDYMRDGSFIELVANKLCEMDSDSDFRAADDAYRRMYK